MRCRRAHLPMCARDLEQRRNATHSFVDRVVHLGAADTAAGGAPVSLGLDRVEHEVGNSAGGHAERCATGHVERKMGPDQLASHANKHRHGPDQLRRRSRQQPGTDDGSVVATAA